MPYVTAYRDQAQGPRKLRPQHHRHHCKTKVYRNQPLHQITKPNKLQPISPPTNLPTITTSPNTTMSYPRTLPLRRFAPALRTQRTAAFSTYRPNLASQDYGSGAGDPKGENPQQQGANPSADKEHPGPPPPAAGKGTGSTPTKGGEKSSNDTSGQKKGTQSKNGAEPKILNENPPKDGEAPADVEQHNRDMDQRAEKAHEKASNADAEKDKVGKGFWSGRSSLNTSSPVKCDFHTNTDGSYRTGRRRQATIDGAQWNECSSIWKWKVVHSLCIVCILLKTPALVRTQSPHRIPTMILDRYHNTMIDDSSRKLQDWTEQRFKVPPNLCEARIMLRPMIQRSQYHWKLCRAKYIWTSYDRGYVCVAGPRQAKSRQHTRRRRCSLAPHPRVKRALRRLSWPSNTRRFTTIA